MGRKLVHFIVVLTFVSLPAVRSECRWPGAVLSEGYCFLFNETKSAYSDANAECQSKGGALAKLTTMAQFLKATERLTTGELWIGARFDVNRGNWIWEYDNTVATELSMFWDVDPKNSDCAQLVVFSATYKKLYSYTCSETLSFLCMFKDLTDLITTQDTTLMTSTQTSLVTSAVQSQMTSTDPTTSTQTSLVTSAVESRMTTTTVNTPTKAITNAIASSTSTVKVPITTLMKCGANFIEINIPLLVNLCVLTYLIG